MKLQQQIPKRNTVLIPASSDAWQISRGFFFQINPTSSCHIQEEVFLYFIIIGVVKMGEILRNAVENRRSELISKLLYFRVFKKEDQHLYELSLSDLELESKKYDHYMHPHDDMGSIQWVRSK